MCFVDVAMSTNNKSNNARNVVKFINDGEYNAIQAMNYSGMKHFMKSPMHYRHWLANKDDTANMEESTALRLGRATHCLALEGRTRFNEKFAVSPVVDRRTKEGKSAWQSFIEENAGKDFVRAEEYALALNIADRFSNNKFIVSLMEKDPSFITEGALVADVTLRDNVTKVRFKCRFDMYFPELGVFVDLKTSQFTPTYQKAKYIIGDNNYHLQEHVYTRVARSLGLPVCGFVFSIIEKSEPYGIGHFTTSSDTKDQACEIFEAFSLDYANCLAKNEWKGISSEDLPIEI
jgi:exodeoxyribonuclease VIII